VAEVENALERALRLAAGEPAHRPDFYAALLASTVFVLGSAEEAGSGTRTLARDEQVSIQHWARQDGSPVIPFFSSLEALRRAIDSGRGYIGLPARTLFEMTRGASLVLNPGSAFGKEFLPDEIEALLSGGVNRQPEETKATQVVLGQPLELPTRLLESVKVFLATRPAVKAAWLAQMQDPLRYETPHLVIGVEAEGEIDRLFRELGAVAGDAAAPGVQVDLVRVTPGERGLSEYFLASVKPFHQR
jgi:hypothetical protein